MTNFENFIIILFYIFDKKEKAQFQKEIPLQSFKFAVLWNFHLTLNGTVELHRKTDFYLDIRLEWMRSASVSAGAREINSDWLR